MPQDNDTRPQTRISRLSAFAPALRGPADTWIEVTLPRGSGTASDPYVMGSGVPRLTKAALEFVDMLYDAGWVLKGFDWAQWSDTTEGLSLHSDLGAVEAATEQQLAMLLTALVRKGRFTDGVVAEAFQTGLVAAMAARAAVLSVKKDDHGRR